MAAITIRNLPDDVVAALKKRAKKNSRSMEAEAREALTRLAAGDDVRSGVEEQLARQLHARRFSVPGSEIMARIEANPPAEEEQRVTAEWLAELDKYRGHFFEEDFRDPWERADGLLEAARARQERRG